MYVLRHHTRRLLQETASILASAPLSNTTIYNNNSNFNNNDDLNPNAFHTHLSPSMAIILAALLTALFFMAFFSIYVKRCTSGRSDEPRPHTIAPPRPPHALSQGVDSAFLQSLPVVSYKPSKKKGSTVECVVCIAEFEEGEPLRQLPRCKHVFHKECIDMWLSSHTTCPLCRRSVVSDGSRSFRWSGSRSLRLSIGRRWGGEGERGMMMGSSTPNEGEGSVYDADSHASIQRKALLLRSHSTGHSSVKKAQSGVLRMGTPNYDDADKVQPSIRCLPLTPSAGFQRSRSMAAMDGNAPAQINVSGWMRGAGASMKRVWSLKRVRPAADPAAASSSSAGGAV